MILGSKFKVFLSPIFMDRKTGQFLNFRLLLLVSCDHCGPRKFGNRSLLYMYCKHHYFCRYAEFYFGKESAAWSSNLAEIEIVGSTVYTELINQNIVYKVFKSFTRRNFCHISIINRAFSFNWKRWSECY